MELDKFKATLREIFPDAREDMIEDAAEEALMWVEEEVKDKEDQLNAEWEDRMRDERLDTEKAGYEAVTRVYRRHCDVSERTTPLENVGGMWSELAMELSPMENVGW